MTWPIDVNQSLSTATPVFAQWLKNSVQGHSDGSTKVKPHGRTFSKGDLASEHYCWICSLSRLEMKAESLVWHHFPGPATHLVTNWHVEFLYLIKGSNLCSVEQTLQFSSGQLLSRVWLFVTPWTAARQASLPTPRVYSNSCPLSQWCHPTISSSVIPFSLHLQSFPASGSFPVESVLCIMWPKC